MHAAAPAIARRGRLTTWFVSGPGVRPAIDPAPIVPTPGDARHLVEGRLYDEIGEFLVRHRLSPIPVHFEIAHAHLTGANPAIAAAVTTMLADGGTLDPDGVARLVATLRPAEPMPQALAALADQLESRLAECLNAVDRSHVSARDYGDALDRAQTMLAADPPGTFDRIAVLTRNVVETTRLVESELQHTRRETERLRDDLDRAQAAADRDHLTGLPNRRGFERRVSDVLARDAADGVDARPLTIGLCDIDDFKHVNDRHGHAAGDRVLTFVGNLLADDLGADVCVARHGGEEFAVLFDGHGLDEAAAMLDGARARLGARSLINQDTGVAIGRLTFSAGIAPLVDDVGRTLAAADVALYRAKRSGKNAVQIATATD